MDQLLDEEFELILGNEKKINIALENINNILESASEETQNPNKKFAVQLSLLAETINEICFKNGKDPCAIYLQLFSITHEMKKEGAL